MTSLCKLRNLNGSAWCGGWRQRITLEEYQELPEPHLVPFSPMVWLLFVLLLYRERHPLGRKLFRHLPRLDTVRPCKRLEINGEVTGVSVGCKATESISFVDHLRDWAATTLRWMPAIRLFDGHPECDDIRLAVAALRITSFIEMIDFPPSTSIVQGFRLTSRAQRWGCLAGSVYSNWEHPERRVWLAATVGDWLLALELAKTTCEPSLVSFIAQRAEECVVPLVARSRKDMTTEASCGLYEMLHVEPDFTRPLWGRLGRSDLPPPEYLTLVHAMEYGDPSESPEWKKACRGL